MKRWFAVLLTAGAVAVAAPVRAQDAAPGQGTVVVTIIPGGGSFFTESKTANGPSFGNYDLGGAVAVNFNRYVGVEGEVSGSLGVSQDLAFNGRTSNLKSPNLLNYSGNIVISAANHTSFVPYVTGGIGGLSLFEKTGLGISGTDTFLTGNVGAGVKWYAGRWGLRGDYRFVAVQSKDDAPAFWGTDTRYGHRIYGGLLLNIGQ